MIFKAAEERYQRELIAHADAVKQNEQLKEQVSKLKTQLRDHGNAAETARSMLSTAEASWQSQRAALNKEILDANSRSVIIFDYVCSVDLSPIILLGAKIYKNKTLSYTSI